MSRIVHFELPADNPERAIEFYKKVLGWDVQKWEGPVNYWLVSTGPKDQPGIDGGIVSRSDRQASGVLVTAQVDSIEVCLEKIKESGGEIIVPKRPIPGVGYQAHFRDTEGNVIGIMESDPTAR
jgi:uncharacterized protein